MKNRLAKAGIRWIVFAGAAAYYYGSKRKVTDIDILVKGVDLEKVEAVLRDIEGVDVVADLRMWMVKLACFSWIKQRRKLFHVETPVIPIEDNVIFKAILQRTEKEGKRDTEDVLFMIENEKIDLQYLKKQNSKVPR